MKYTTCVCVGVRPLNSEAPAYVNNSLDFTVKYNILEKKLIKDKESDFVPASPIYVALCKFCSSICSKEA